MRADLAEERDGAREERAERSRAPRRPKTEDAEERHAAIDRSGPVRQEVRLSTVMAPSA